jgi:hypothetical protein
MEDRKKTKNVIKNNIEDDDNNSYIEDETEYTSELEDLLNEEYDENVLILIQKELLNYVEEKSLPICEYLTIDNIYDFILEFS